jgi:hypothetical protein
MTLLINEGDKCFCGAYFNANGYCSNGHPAPAKMTPLKCPNCSRDMKLEVVNYVFANEKYDKWICEDCTHIIVLDWRGEEKWG